MIIKCFLRNIFWKRVFSFCMFSRNFVYLWSKGLFIFKNFFCFFENYVINHTFDCNQHCTVSEVIFQLPACWFVIAPSRKYIRVLIKNVFWFGVINQWPHVWLERFFWINHPRNFWKFWGSSSSLKILER